MERSPPRAATASALGSSVEPGADRSSTSLATEPCASVEAIYQALYVQGRGALRRELTACLRTGRTLRVPRARTRGRGKSFVTPELLISQRPATVLDRAVPGHWEGDLILGLRSSAIGTLVERTTRLRSCYIYRLYQSTAVVPAQRMDRRSLVTAQRRCVTRLRER